MKVLLSVAVWGRGYAETFVHYALASQLCDDNIPLLAREHDVVYHIMTTRKDAAWMRRQPEIGLLDKHARIDWDFLENHGFKREVIPVGPDGKKYSFLSLLQNVAIEKSLEHDALVFNYADFIWANGSLTRSIGMLRDGIDAVLSFCLPVDRDSGIRALDKFCVQGSSGARILNLPPRAGADLAIRCLHREARLRYWDGPAFTVTPTYLLWPVGKEGVVIRAYHQTILALRVKPDDPVYRAGIQSGSLDGDFTILLAERANIHHAVNSDEVLAFSLYDTIIDSSIRGPSRTSWANFNREESLRECLRVTIGDGQREFALLPIEVRRDYQNPERWDRVVQQSRAVLEKIHATTAFDPTEYEWRHKEGANLRQLADAWRKGSVSSVAGIILYQRIIVRLTSGRLGNFLKSRLGPNLSRALRLTAERIIYRSPAPVKVSPHGSIDPFVSRDAGAQSHSDGDLLKLWLQLFTGDVSQLVHRLHSNLMAACFTGTAGRLLGKMLGPARMEALRAYLGSLFIRGFQLAPNVRVNRTATLSFRAAFDVESGIGRINSVKEVNAVLAKATEKLIAVTQEAPLWAEGHRALGRNYWFQGRYGEALNNFRRGEACLAEVANAAGWDPNAAVILPSNCNQVIGLMGHLDAFVKRKILTGDPRPYYLLAPEDETVNRAFLDYWSDFITIVTDIGEVKRLSRLEPVYGVNWNWIMPDDEEGVVHIHSGIARVQRWWEREGRGPLLKLTDAHAGMVAHQLAAWGLEKSDWFVCLHVRSSGFYDEGVGTAQHFRNTPIEDYYPLIRMILEQGGWVIRMGHPSAPPLDRAAFGELGGRVIDYAHAPERSPELDVALCASCRLFVSSPSGLHTVAHAFGRPVCPVNFPIYAGFPWHPGEIFIPQRYYSRDLGRELTLAEILSSDVPRADHHFLLEKAGLELIHDKPVEIVETVREALDPNGYTVACADKGRRVIEEFDRLNRAHGMDISGRLGLHFAATYARELCPEVIGAVPASSGATDPIEEAAVERKLDVIIPSYNRPAVLYRLLRTGLDLRIPGMSFVVFDDGSTVAEYVPELGLTTTAQVCASFRTRRVVYIRNPENMGVAATWDRYYRDLCAATYTMSVTDKDEFINAAPIVSALAKLDADPKVSMVIIPMRQKDRSEDDRPMLFDYWRMSGKEYLAQYVQDTMLQHCSMWGIMRVDAARRAGVPRPMGLRRYGLDDGFGIDIDFVFMVAATGDVEFESEPHVRRSTLAGGTEKYPLTFAYTYYQYAKRAMRELQARGVVSEATRRCYIGLWLLLISRGLVVAYRPVHGTELERGTARIRRHLPLPILFYLPLEALRYGIRPTKEVIGLYTRAIGIMGRIWITRWRGRAGRLWRLLNA